MLTRRVLFTSLLTVIGIGLAIPALSASPGGGVANPGSRTTYRSTIYSQSPYAQNAYTRRSFTAPYPRRFVGYPCTWAGSRDLAHGETAYRSGRYTDAISQWKTAASKDCAIAAYKLGMLYFGGKSQVAADRSLGTAWLQLAADSESAGNPYYQKMSRLAVGTLTKSQRAQYASDYVRLRTALGLPAAN